MHKWHIPRKIRKRVDHLTARYDTPRMHIFSFTVRHNPNYQELVAIGPKAIPPLIEDLKGKIGWSAGWRVDLITDIAARFKLPPIEDFRSRIEAQLRRDLPNTDHGMFIAEKDESGFVDMNTYASAFQKVVRRWAMEIGLYDYRIKSKDKRIY